MTLDLQALIKALLTAAVVLTLPGCVLSLQDFARLQESTEAQNDRARAAAEAALFAREGLVRYDSPSLVVDLTRDSMRRCELWEHGSPAEPGERVTLQVLEVVDGATPAPVTAPLEAGCSFIQGNQLLEVTTPTGEVRELMRRPRWLAQDRSGGLVEYELLPVAKERRVKVAPPCEDAMPESRQSVFVVPPATHALWKAPVRRLEPVTWEEVELLRSCAY